MSGIWQIHPFGEGNTRTTAIFTIKYLRSLGFEVENDAFAENSWYFRNALVRANYRNVSKGIEYEPIFLIRFFRNLLMGEQNELKNRYLLVNPPEEWELHTSTPKTPEQVPEQVPDKHRLITGQVQDKFHTNNMLVIELIRNIGHEEMSISQMMEKLKLKHRPNFMEYHLNPAMREGFVQMMFPDSPRHPRQKYLLTVKGLALYNELAKEQ